MCSEPLSSSWPTGSVAQCEYQEPLLISAVLKLFRVVPVIQGTSGTEIHLGSAADQEAPNLPPVLSQTVDIVFGLSAL